jgi:hypothetical protein
MENIDDPTNLTGISKLLNRQHVNDKIDLEALERDMIGGGGVRKIKVNEPAKEFRSRMQEINKSSGMDVLSGDGDFSSDSESDHVVHTKRAPSHHAKPKSAVSKSYDGSDSDSDSSNGDTDSDMSSDINSSESFENSGSDEMMDIMRGRRPKSQPNVEPTNTNYRPVDRHAPLPTSAPPQRQPSYPAQPPPHAHAGYQGQQYPQQAYPQMAPPHGNAPGYYGPVDPLDQAMQTYAGNTMDYGLASREDEEEKKSELLEDIDELKYELEEDDVDLSRIPEVDQDSTMEEIHNVRKILRRKYDRRRFNSFGTEFILAFAQGVEYICDGERKIGNMTVPDLTNWHNTVRTKLRKLRYETSTIVSGTMEKFNIGPVGRLGLELVPSAFLHSKMRKDQKGKANYTTNQMSAAYDQLSQYDD